MSLTQNLRDAVRWAKRNPLIGLIGVIAPVVGAVAAIPPAWNAVSEFLGVPRCVFYSSVYYYADGHFKEGSADKWIEYQAHAQNSFVEMSRNRDYITLINKTPRDDPRWADMLVRLPVCSGTAQWTYENPEQWTDLYQVTTKVSAEMLHEQTAYEAVASQ